MTAPDDPRTELAAVAASLRAYLEWQEDTGASGIPRAARRRPSAVAAPAEPRTEPQAAPRIDAHVEPQAASRIDALVEPQAASRIDALVEPQAAPRVDAHVETQAAPRVANAGHGNPGGQPTDYTSPFATEAERAPRVVPPVAPAPHVAPIADAAPVDRATRLPVLAGEVAGCVKCVLHETRKQTVFARGSADASLCIVGEAPGADEDAQGLPFVGRAGQLLDRMIGAMGLAPDKDVYVCNIIKCRPPGNRRPEPIEIDTCIPYLHEQLALVKPKVIVAMGNTAVSALLGTKLGITKLRGQWKLYRGTTLVMPTYHPSYLLRPSAQQVEAKKQAWEDLQQVMKELGLAPPPRKRDA